MHRRSLVHALAMVALLPAAGSVRAAGLASLSDADAAGGLKAALELGAQAAVKGLGRPDGFLSDARVRIPLPSPLKEGAKLLSQLGMKRQLEELEVAMNRAAEAAVPLAGQLLADAVRSMTVEDARRILTGGDTSVTQFFADKTRQPLTEAFLPTVKEQTARVGVAEKYDRVAKKAAGMGLVRQEDASIDHYVTRKALDGLYYMIGEEEKKIRRNPLGAGHALVGKVFGALK